MVPHLGLLSNSYFPMIQVLARQVALCCGKPDGLIALIIEKVGEVRKGSGFPAQRCPGIETALRVDEELAKLPKEYKVIVDCRLAIADFSIETRNSKMY